MRKNIVFTVLVAAFIANACKPSQNSAAPKYAAAETGSGKMQLYYHSAVDNSFPNYILTNGHTGDNAYCLYAYSSTPNDTTSQSDRLKRAVRVESNYSDYNKAFNEVNSVWSRIFRDGLIYNSASGFNSLLYDDLARITDDKAAERQTGETMVEKELEAILLATKKFATSKTECPKQFPGAGH